MQLKTIDYVMCMDQDIIDTVDNKREFYNFFSRTILTIVRFILCDFSLNVMNCKYTFHTNHCI